MDELADTEWALVMLVLAGTPAPTSSATVRTTESPRIVDLPRETLPTQVLAGIAIALALVAGILGYRIIRGGRGL